MRALGVFGVRSTEARSRYEHGWWMTVDDIHNGGPAIRIGPALRDDKMCDASVRLLSQKLTWSEYAQRHTSDIYHLECT